MAERRRKQYELTDLLIAVLTTELRKEVNRLDAIGFDELQAPRITKLTKEMIARLLKSNNKAFIKIAKEASEEASDDIEKLGIVATPIIADGKYVEGVLKEYNPVTGYLYYPEADRKRARLAEALIAAVIIGIRADYHKELRTFANLWHTQTKQYAETMVDETRKRTFKKNGIKYVRWVTQADEKVCKECGPRHMKVYPLDNLPPKHYNCRCWIEPVREKDSNGK